MQLWEHLVEEHLNKRNPRLAEKKQVSKSRTVAKGTFPSVVAIRQQNAIHREVRSLQQEDMLMEEQILSVLPSRYDWTIAIEDTALRRSLAFWLLDVGVIVSNITKLKRSGIRYLGTISIVPQILTLCYSRYWSEAKLCHWQQPTKWDLDRCKTLLEHTSNLKFANVITDSSLACGKPDGYIREWLRSPNHGPLVIDGASEVIRICNTQRRVQERKPLPQASPLLFVLRFETGSNLEDWKQLVSKTMSAIEVNQCGLDGLSFSSTEVSEVQQFVGEVKLLLEYMRIECPAILLIRTLDIDLRGCNTIGLDGTDGETITLLEELSRSAGVGLITVDATNALLTSAGALCTRVIGVRDQEVEGHVRRHYYIDDGCYGSLCVADGNSLTPLPLFPQNRPPETYDTSVWGPTCDGLDRVCQGIQLPAMQRDDWLVFAGMTSGSEGMSTAFNGFNPPDTAYCVLGYFSKKELRSGSLSPTNLNN